MRQWPAAELPSDPTPLAPDALAWTLLLLSLFLLARAGLAWWVGRRSRQAPSPPRDSAAPTEALAQRWQALSRLPQGLSADQQQEAAQLAAWLRLELAAGGPLYLSATDEALLAAFPADRELAALLQFSTTILYACRPQPTASWQAIMETAARWRTSRHAASSTEEAP